VHEEWILRAAQSKLNRAAGDLTRRTRPMPTVDFYFWPLPPVSCVSESCAVMQTSRRMRCAKPELSLEGVEYEANHCRSSLHLHTRGGGYRRWPASCAPISGGGGKPIDKLAILPAAETDTGHFAMPVATIAACGARGRKIKSNQIRCFADAVIYRVARAAPRCRVVRPSWRGSAQSR
jgi:hypothetical protein